MKPATLIGLEVGGGFGSKIYIYNEEVICTWASKKIGGRPVKGAGHAAEVLLEGYGLAVVPWEVHPTSYLRFSARYVERDLEALAELGRNGPIAAG